MVTTATLRMEADSRELERTEQVLDRVTGAATRTEGAAFRLGNAFLSSGFRVGGASSRLSAFTSNTRNVGLAAQNTSYQVGDFFVQIASGTSWVVALSQQLPQLLGGFGVLGAGLGAAVAIGGAMYLMFGDNENAAKALERQLQDLNKALDAYDTAMTNSLMSTGDMEEEFGAANSTLRETLDILRDIAASNAQRSVTALSDGLSDALGTAGAGDPRAEMAKFYNANIFLAFTDAQREMRSEARQLTSEFLNSQAALKEAGDDLEAQEVALNRMLQASIALSDLEGNRSAAEEEITKRIADQLLAVTKLVDIRGRQGDQEAAYLARQAAAYQQYAQTRVRSEEMLRQARMVDAYQEYGGSRAESDLEVARAREISQELQKQIQNQQLLAFASDKTAEVARQRLQVEYDNFIAMTRTLGITESARDAMANLFMEANKIASIDQSGQIEMVDAGLRRQIEAYKQYYDSRVAGEQMVADAQARAYEYVASTRAESDAATNSAQEMLDTLLAQAQANEAIRNASDEAAEMARQRAQAEYDAHMEMLDSLDVSESMKNELDLAYQAANGIASVDMAGNISLATEEARKLAETLQRAIALAPITSAMRDEDAAMSQSVIPDASDRQGQRDAVENYNRILERMTKDAEGPKPRKRSGGGGRGGKSEAEREAERLENERLRERDRILNQISTSTERYNSEMRDLTELYELGYLKADQYARAAAMIRDEYNQTQFANVYQGIEMLSSGLADAVAEWEGFGEAIRGIIHQIGRDLLESGIRAAMLQAFGLGAGGTGAGATGMLGTIFGSFFGGGRANGGPAKVGKMYEINERGGEFFQPGTSGYITSNDNLRGALGGSQKVEVSLKMNTPLFKAEVEQASERVSIRNITNNNRERDGALPGKVNAARSNTHPRLRT